MRKILSIICLVFITFGTLMQPVEAKRFGGGRSFGYQRSASSYSKPQSTQMPYQAPRSSGMGKWLGPLAGLAAGGLLASLFMGKGLGSGILSWVLILGGGLILWSFIRNRLRPQAQFTQTSDNTFNNNISQFTPIQNTSANSLPVGFDETAMLRDAKVQFMRLQAAYDAKNLDDLREFTTPEVYAEIQLQFQERGEAHNQTEVVKLDANLLDATTELQYTIASVSFSGLIRENPDEPAIPFQETWHFKKLNSEMKWLVAGIQQDNN